jgi:hypothetical protein
MNRCACLVTAVFVSSGCLAAGAAGIRRAGADEQRGATARPAPSSFTRRVDNPWFPLRPGTRYVYTGVKDGAPSRDVVTVTHGMRTIDGVRCAVVNDRLYLRGRLEERTTDWYSQDARGNVWYFGEDTAELDRRGHVKTTAGSWEAGVRGARAGVYMPARPRVGQSARQEFSKGEAEDHFRVIGVFGAVTAQGAKNALLTEEWTPLEPGTIDHKLYVRGIGTVLEQTERGGDERNELVSVSRA